MKKTLLYILLSIITLAGKAQPYTDKFLVMGSPQHLFISAISLDFNVKIKDRSWIVFSPQYYFDEEGKSPGLTTGYSSLSGGGLGISNKLFITNLYSFYFTYGAAYHYFDIPGVYSYPDYNYPYSYSYYVSYPPRQNITINRLTGSCTFGYQKRIGPHFFLDLYIGFGMRYSILSNDQVNVNRSMFDYGYSGVMLLSGVKIGVGL